MKRWIGIVLVMLMLAGCGGAGEPRESTDYQDSGFQPNSPGQPPSPSSRRLWEEPVETLEMAAGDEPFVSELTEDELLDDTRHRAEQGNSFHQTMLGIRYLEGDGVLKNDAEAIKWFRKAAEQSDADSHYGAAFGVVTAQFYLGLMYVQGWGVPQDFPEAVKWYRMAAERGHALSQHVLGLMYRAGALGVVPQDLVQAYAWFNIAATQGNEDAARERKGLGEAMTNEQRTRAQELSREYWETYVLPFRSQRVQDLLR